MVLLLILWLVTGRVDDDCFVCECVCIRFFSVISSESNRPNRSSELRWLSRWIFFFSFSRFLQLRDVLAVKCGRIERRL